MTDPVNFSEARERLDEIVKQVRSKDVSLEKSLDLFDEAIKMGNSCFEMIDRIDAGDMENASSDGEDMTGADATSASQDTTQGALAENETTVEQQSDEGLAENAQIEEDIREEETSSANED